MQLAQSHLVLNLNVILDIVQLTIIDERNDDNRIGCVLHPSIHSDICDSIKS